MSFILSNPHSAPGRADFLFPSRAARLSVLPEREHEHELVGGYNNDCLIDPDHRLTLLFIKALATTDSSLPECMSNLTLDWRSDETGLLNRVAKSPVAGFMQSRRGYAGLRRVESPRLKMRDLQGFGSFPDSCWCQLDSILTFADPPAGRRPLRSHVVHEDDLISILEQASVFVCPPAYRPAYMQACLRRLHLRQVPNGAEGEDAGTRGVLGGKYQINSRLDRHVSHQLDRTSTGLELGASQRTSHSRVVDSVISSFGGGTLSILIPFLGICPQAPRRLISTNRPLSPRTHTHAHTHTHVTTAFWHSAFGDESAETGCGGESVNLTKSHMGNSSAFVRLLVCVLVCLRRCVLAFVSEWH
ncbi:unnamed protein product [Protopolystoma xenopodis]|uniref:Uncharacterized protein n=1 Tax=Protopolystoma xenopodis TaxID=117903 RepID=A0A448XKG2_9PLAT|nr:unnamed protein product [Protopolystoma xenopodis]